MSTLTLLVFATLPLLIVLVEYARRLMRASFRQIRVRLAAMNAFAQEHLSGIKVVQLLGRAHDGAARVRRDQRRPPRCVPRPDPRGLGDVRDRRGDQLVAIGGRHLVRVGPAHRADDPR